MGMGTSRSAGGVRTSQSWCFIINADQADTSIPHIFPADTSHMFQSYNKDRKLWEVSTGTHWNSVVYYLKILITWSHDKTFSKKEMWKRRIWLFALATSLSLFVPHNHIAQLIGHNWAVIFVDVNQCRYTTTEACMYLYYILFTIAVLCMWSMVYLRFVCTIFGGSSALSLSLCL